MVKKRFRLHAYASLYLNSIIVLMVILASIWMTTGLIPSANKTYSALGTAAFRYFTVDSNILMGVTALLLAVRNILKILGKKVSCGTLLSVLNLAAVAGVTLTFLAVLLIIAPHSPKGFRSLYMESNLFFHLFVPLLAVIDYIFLSDHERIRWTWCFAAAVPAFIYGVYYCVPIVTNVRPDGTFAEGCDWYRFFGNSISNLFPRLLLFAALEIALCLLLWFLSDRRALTVMRRQAREGGDSDFNPVSANLASTVVTASEYYQTAVIRIICTVAPLVGLCAAVVFTGLWLSGNYSFSFAEIFIFDCVCESYLVVALYLFKTCIGPDGVVIQSKVLSGKTILTFLLFLQWNLISYLAPFRDFWAYSPMFILLSALFIDSKLVLVNIAAQALSITVSWLVRGENLLPPPDGAFVSSIVLRVTLLFLGYSLIYLLVYLIEKELLITLDRLSDYDTLTHALNRRQLAHRISDAVSSFYSDGDAFCLAIFDLDDFKAVNDTYGHTSGDEVLVEFVRIINSSVTANDYVFRYGGEEFLVVFRCAPEAAAESCRRVLRRLKSADFRFFPEGQCQTATAGLARYTGGMSADGLINLADERLYLGKHNGKDQLVFE